LTKILGTHTMTIGAYVVFAQKNEQSSANLQGILTFDSSNTTVSTGNAFADLLLGTSRSTNSGISSPNTTTGTELSNPISKTIGEPPSASR